MIILIKKKLYEGGRFTRRDEIKYPKWDVILFLRLQAIFFWNLPVPKWIFFGQKLSVSFRKNENQVLFQLQTWKLGHTNNISVKLIIKTDQMGSGKCSHLPTIDGCLYLKWNSFNNKFQEYFIILDYLEVPRKFRIFLCSIILRV